MCTYDSTTHVTTTHNKTVNYTFKWSRNMFTRKVGALWSRNMFRRKVGALQIGHRGLRAMKCSLVSKMSLGEEEGYAFSQYWQHSLIQWKFISVACSMLNMEG